MLAWCSVFHASQSASIDVVLAVTVEGTAPVRSQSLSPLRTSPWTSRGGLANNDCSLICEMLQNFSSVHQSLEDDGERLY